MANDKHVALLKQGVSAWNAWRDENPDIRPDLSRLTLNGANFSEANLNLVNLEKASLKNAYLFGASLVGANLFEANLSGACFSRANLGEANLGSASLRRAELDHSNLGLANLVEADLCEAILVKSELISANFSRANLSNSNLRQANAIGANFSGAVLRGAELFAAQFLDTDFTGADLTGCLVFGISAWGLKLDGTQQENLVITRRQEPEITVDNIEVAQFVYLLLHNQKIRNVIDSITSKTVLILGRFTNERKAVLDEIRNEVRKRDYLPILFDFKKPRNRDTDETITLLARMARFVIADITDAKSVLHELRAIVPDLPSVPVQSIILATQEEPGMFDFYRHRPSFLAVHRYADQAQLLADLGDKVIRPAELKVRELRG